MDDAFELFRDNFGPPQDPVDAATRVADYEGRLPARLLAHWKADGFAGYRKGLLWITDPAQFADIASMWVRDLGFQDFDRFHTVARTAFGQLYLWGERTGHSLVLHPAMGFALPRADDMDDMKEGKADLCAAQFFGFLSPEEVDVEDEDGKPMFARALKKLGPLKATQMYGFEPAIPFGGSADLDALRRVSALEHLTIVSQASEKELVDSEAFTDAARRHGLL